MAMVRKTALAILLALAAVSTVAADQSDASLALLFAELRTTMDADRAADIEGRIWRLWSNSQTEAANEPFNDGVFLMSQGALLEAQAKFSKAIEIAPEFAEAWNKRATVLFYLGKTDESVRDIQRTLALEPRHFGALSGLAMINRDLGRDEAALDVLNQTMEIYPAMPGIDERMKSLLEAIARKNL